MSLSWLTYFWDMLNHSPNEIFRKYPIFLLGLLILLALIIARLLAGGPIAGEYLIGLIAGLIAIYGIMTPRE